MWTKLEEVETGNSSGVGAKGKDVVIVAPRRTMSQETAANLGIWLLLLSCPEALSEAAFAKFTKEG